jgi:hypothetical protein
MQNAPAEVLKISPDALEIANQYLQDQDINKTANTLGIGVDIVSSTLDKKEVKSYVNQVFADVGYNNRVKMRAAMDALITRKFQDMREADVGSSKDITDILALSHKMSMDILDREIALEKLKDANIRNQTNIQINDASTNYSALLEKLLGAPN